VIVFVGQQHNIEKEVKSIHSKDLYVTQIYIMASFFVMPDKDSQWALAGCCEREEWIFIGLYGAYYLLTHFFYWKDFMKPMKLLCVFVHEMGHASATWLTCGKVKNIEVYQNEGGITGFSGGWRTIIIPAGYVGGAFWGGCFVTLSGNRIGSTVAAGIVAAALLIALV
jgi:Peptidase M50B-like